MDSSYIYALRDPRDLEFRYIGKTNNPNQRLLEHSHYPRSSGLRRLVLELAAIGLSLQLVILQKCRANEWRVWEKYWIDLARKLGVNLFNIMPGGTGPPDGKRPIEWARQISAGLRGIKRGPLSEEHRAKLSAIRMGRKLSLETRKKISIANKGKKRTAEQRAKLSAAFIGKKKGPPSLKHRENLSLANLGQIPWSKGRSLSLEHRAKISAAHIRRNRH